MIKKIIFLQLAFMVLLSSFGLAQEREFAKRTKAKYVNWGLLQLIPSPLFVNDANNDNARVQLGLQWQIIPLNYSFRANKFVSPLQSFMISPVRRFTGSAELYGLSRHSS